MNVRPHLKGGMTKSRCVLSLSFLLGDFLPLSHTEILEVDIFFYCTIFGDVCQAIILGALGTNELKSSQTWAGSTVFQYTAFQERIYLV